MGWWANRREEGQEGQLGGSRGALANASQAPYPRALELEDPCFPQYPALCQVWSWVLPYKSSHYVSLKGFSPWIFQFGVCSFVPDTASIEGSTEELSKPSSPLPSTFLL